MVSESEIKAGQAVYTAMSLKIYNLLVLYISNNWIWRCSRHYQLAQYQDYVRAHHLDIGVGTGYYLKHMQWATYTQLSLMDLNPSCLKTASKAVAWLSPKTYLADIFKPQIHLIEQFDSISMNYLLHCLPGNMQEKSVVINHAVAMLKPQGVLFGATILSDSSLQTSMSLRLMDFYNKKQIFLNKADHRVSLQGILETYLSDVEINIIGCVALFKGTKKSAYLKESTNDIYILPSQ